jgi:uncharacterized membrane protein
MLAMAKPRQPRWYAVPARALFLAFLLTLLTFAITLFGAIAIVVISGALRGQNPDMRFAYRHVALPVAVVVGSAGLIIALVMEIRHYRQARALEGIARASR